MCSTLIPITTFLRVIKIAKQSLLVCSATVLRRVFITFSFQSCLSKKDVRYGVYLVKRCLFLQRLAAAVASCPLVHAGDTRWVQHMGEPLRPALLVRPLARVCPCKMIFVLICEMFA